MDETRGESLTELQTFSAGVLIPVFQAVFTGAFLAALVFCVAYVIGQASLVILGLTFGAGAFLAWSLLLANWVKLNNFVVGAFDAPQYIDAPSIDVGEDPPALPEPEPVYVRVELRQENRLQLIDLPAEPGQLKQLALGVVRGETLAEGVWTGRGRPFSKAQFHELRQEFFRRGLAYWVCEGAPAQGWKLNHAGLTILKQFTTTALPALYEE